LHVEGGGDGFALAVGCLGEQSGCVGQFVDEGDVVGDGPGVFDGLEFGFDGGLLVVAGAELLAEPVAVGDIGGLGAGSQFFYLCDESRDCGLGLGELAAQRLGAGAVGLVLLGGGGRDELGDQGGAVVAEGVLVQAVRQGGGEGRFGDRGADVAGVVLGVAGVGGLGVADVVGVDLGLAGAAAGPA
jgi:hypothetical protein